MTDERFVSLEQVDQASEDERRSGNDRRADRDKRLWTGPERRSGGERRLAKGPLGDRIVSRKLKGFLALLLSFAAVALGVNLMPGIIRHPTEEIIWINQESISSVYDVIVLGAEPEGIAAAVSAARNGKRTLLLEYSSSLGGLYTQGQLNFLDMCYGDDGTLLTRGIFEEFYTAVGGNAFDVTEAKNYFIDLVSREPLLTLRTESLLIGPVMDGTAIAGIRMLEDGTETLYTAGRYIDATSDGDLAYLAGVPYTYGGEDIGERDREMGVSLVFSLSGVSWPTVFTRLNFQRLWGRLTGNPVNVGATARSAWGYEQEGYAYVPRDPMMRMRGFNIARQHSGQVLVNALLVFGVDPLDRLSRLDAVDRVRREMTWLLPYVREHFAGFREAELVGLADRLYVRETRHFVGEYRLTIDDVLGNRDQWDKIAVGGYPADVQPSVAQPFGTVIGSPDRYAVPFRCLVPLYTENLLIVGRCASYTSLAASSARVVPLGMACGQAAGLAAALSLDASVDFWHMSRDHAAILNLQTALREQGAWLEDFEGGDPNASHWAFEGLSTLRRLGLMDGGYQNEYRLEKPMDKWRFQYMLNGVVQKAGYSLDYIEVDEPPSCRQVVAAVAAAYEAADALKQWAGAGAAAGTGAGAAVGAAALRSAGPQPDGDGAPGEGDVLPGEGSAASGTGTALGAGGPAPDTGTALGAGGAAPGAGGAASDEGGVPGVGVASEAGGAALGEGSLPTGEGGAELLFKAAMGRSHADNLRYLADAGLLPAALAPYFADGDPIPLAAETAMLLTNLYHNIRLPNVY